MGPSLSLALALSAVVMVSGISYAGDNDNKTSSSPVQQGFAISPVTPNLKGKEPGKVGLGSYLVNAIGDCSGCHSFPQYLEQNGPGSNPAAGDPYDALTQSASKQRSEEH